MICWFICIFLLVCYWMCFFFSSRRRHTRYWRDWSSDVCSSDLLCVVCDVGHGFLGDAVAGHLRGDRQRRQRLGGPHREAHTGVNDGVGVRRSWSHLARVAVGEATVLGCMLADGRNQPQVV